MPINKYEFGVVLGILWLLLAFALDYSLDHRVSIEEGHQRRSQENCGIEPDQIEEKYYPGLVHENGSCANFDESCINVYTINRVSRLDIFGPEKTFRDSEECRQYVYDYTCLWFVNSAGLSRNRCDIGISGIKPPCRSFCNQLGEVCANNVSWKETCSSIPCLVDLQDLQCTPGPFSSGQDVNDTCTI